MFCFKNEPRVPLSAQGSIDSAIFTFVEELNNHRIFDVAMQQAEFSNRGGDPRGTPAPPKPEVGGQREELEFNLTAC